MTENTLHPTLMEAVMTGDLADMAAHIRNGPSKESPGCLTS